MTESETIGRNEKQRLAAERQANVEKRKAAKAEFEEATAFEARSASFHNEIEDYREEIDEVEAPGTFVMPPNRITIPEGAIKHIPGQDHYKTLARWLKNYRRPQDKKKNIQGGDKMRAYRPRKGDDYTWTFQEPWMLEAFRFAWCQVRNSRGRIDSIPDGGAYLSGGDSDGE